MICILYQSQDLAIHSMSLTVYCVLKVGVEAFFTNYQKYG